MEALKKMKIGKALSQNGISVELLEKEGEESEYWKIEELEIPDGKNSS